MDKLSIKPFLQSELQAHPHRRTHFLDGYVFRLFMADGITVDEHNALQMIISRWKAGYPSDQMKWPDSMLGGA